jgi:hypothetical protein
MEGTDNGRVLVRGWEGKAAGWDVKSGDGVLGACAVVRFGLCASTLCSLMVTSNRLAWNVENTCDLLWHRRETHRLRIPNQNSLASVDVEPARIRNAILEIEEHVRIRASNEVRHSHSLHVGRYIFPHRKLHLVRLLLAALVPILDVRPVLGREEPPDAGRLFCPSQQLGLMQQHVPPETGDDRVGGFKGFLDVAFRPDVPLHDLEAPGAPAGEEACLRAGGGGGGENGDGAQGWGGREDGVGDVQSNVPRGAKDQNVGGHERRHLVETDADLGVRKGV